MKSEAHPHRMRRPFATDEDRTSVSHPRMNFFTLRNFKGPTMNGCEAREPESRVGRFAELIPNPIDQNPWAHWRSPMDMMRQG
jgi:hypothetical protein